MKPTMKRMLAVLLAVIIIISSYIVVESKREEQARENELLHVTVTTTFIGDAVKQIGGDQVELITLMGPGIDPHQYQASSSDLKKLMGADVIFFGGLHLEAKLAEVLEELESSDTLTVDTSRNIPENQLLLADPNDDQQTGTYDPHIWFDINLWKIVTQDIATVLGEQDPKNKDYYDANLKSFHQELNTLEKYIFKRIDELPEDGRYLVTAHDAFNYFGRYTDMEVQGIQGFNTVVEAGTNDVSQTANLIVEKEVKAVFVESTVSPKLVQALKEAVRARGFNTEIGGELFSDSTGDGGTYEETYLGMYYHNIDTMIDALR